MHDAGIPRNLYVTLRWFPGEQACSATCLGLDESAQLHGAGHAGAGRRREPGHMTKKNRKHVKKKVIHLSVLFLIWPHAVKRNCHPMSEPLAPACEPGTSHARMHFAVVQFFFQEMSKKIKRGSVQASQQDPPN